jgi:hypothetical protein
MATITTYGEGGYDPSKPDGNVIAVTEVPDPEPAPIESALSKLMALGLTEDEARALAGV